MQGFLTSVFARHKKVLSISLIVFLFLIAVFLRFYRVQEVPVSLYWDETAFAYNAYSILRTGRDEYGKFMPLLFQSFNDYKMPGNVYLSVIPIALFGLNEFSTRFTSAFFGSLTVLLSFFLVKELFALQPEKKKEKALFSQKAVFAIATLTMLFFAISPWHLQFSRVGFEANVGLFFVVWGILFFLRFINSGRLLQALLSAIGFGLSVYMYRTIDLFVPLLLIGFLIVFRKHILVMKKNTIISMLVLCAIVLPFLPVILSSGGVSRASQVSIANNSFNEVYQAALLQQKFGNNLFAKAIFNRRIVYGLVFLRNYISHFDPRFLFFQGDINGRHSIIGMGELYFWELPFIIAGVIALFKLNKKIRAVVLLWILLAIIPAATSFPSPHALRSLNLLPMPDVLSAIGVVYIYVFFRKTGFKKLYVLGMSIIVAVNFGYYMHQYYGINAKVTSTSFGDGYKQLMQYIIPRENQYDTIAITGHYWQPYIYALFYKQYDPKLYQAHGSKYGFGKYKFSGTIWEKGEYELDNVNLRQWAGGNRILVALSPLNPYEYQKQKNNIRELKRIYNHEGDLVFVVGEVK